MSVDSGNSGKPDKEPGAQSTGEGTNRSDAGENSGQIGDGSANEGMANDGLVREGLIDDETRYSENGGQPPPSDDSSSDCFELSIDSKAELTRGEQSEDSDRSFKLKSSAVVVPEPEEREPTIGRYVVEKVLGEGGFGSVYLAHDPRLSRKVAIKIPRGDRVIDELVWKGFLSEGRAVAAMRHESIVTIHDIDRTDGGIPFVVMEYIPGNTLRHFIRKNEPDFQFKLQICKQIADALRYAHRQSVIHRDLKPANIIIDDDKRAKIMDFGLALRVDQPMGRIATGVAGTLAFMSPEQVRAENHRMDGRSDIWSLGVIMYWMFTGQRPFHGETMEEVVNEICERDPKPMRQLDDALPPELDRICRKCLQKLMPDRYASAADLVDDLQYLIERSSLSRLADGPLTGSKMRGKAERGARESADVPDRNALDRNALDRNAPGRNAPGRNVPDHGVTNGGATNVVSRASGTRASRTGRDIPGSTSAGASGRVNSASASMQNRSLDSEETSPVRIVPKGLRSFDVNDAEFFRELLPGPVDRFGIPESLRFWTAKLTNEREPLAAGLIFGPSGCGKSSFVKAGLIPQLPEDHEHVYVECSADRIESLLKSKLLRSLNERDLERVDTLELIIGLRTGRYSINGSRLLIVLDQFEQWLSGSRNHAESELVNALRQCDGQMVQVLLLVRDDFWMPVQQFFKLLGYRIQDGLNALALPLFDRRHAVRVLKAFGRAYGALPGESTKLSKQQREFLDAAVDDISRNDRVICAHLSLLADLMQGQPWTKAELTRVGGWEGIGIRFLDQTFSEETARPTVRPSCPAVRTILEALLPESRGPIKGASQPRSELATRIRTDQPGSTDEDVDSALELLDTEMRLITRIDESQLSAESRQHPAAGSEPGFQLAHDVLVKPVRQWLQMKQVETWQGRATVRMKELSGRWVDGRETRNLPTLTEYVQMAGGVSRRQMSPDMKSMFSAATSYFAIRTVGLLLIAGLLAGSYVYQQSRSSEKIIAGQIDRLEQTPPAGIPATIELLSTGGHGARENLTKRIVDAENAEAELRLNLALSHLVPEDEIPVDALINAVETAEAGFAAPVIDALELTKGEQRTKVLSELAQRMSSSEDPKLQARFATTLFFLGDWETVNRFLSFDEWPDQRTAFVHGLKGWMGPATKVIDALELSLGPNETAKKESNGSEPEKTTRKLTDDSVYSLLLACCEADSNFTTSQRDRLEPIVVQHLFQAESKPCILSGCQALVRKFGFQEPELPAVDLPDVRRIDINRQQMTFYRVQQGTIACGRESIVPRQLKVPAFQGNDLPPAPKRLIRMESAFWMSSTPVTARVFKTFLEDPNVIKDLAERGVSPAQLCNYRNLPGKPGPFQAEDGVNWFGAMEFCNWLSRKQGRVPYYNLEFEHQPEEERSEIPVPVAVLKKLDRVDGDGFRLPDFNQYEFAARAGTSTAYYFGHAAFAESFEESYGRYAVSPLEARLVGRCLPSPNGLFDMNGCARQWCDDMNAMNSMCTTFGLASRGRGFSSQQGALYANATGAMRQGFRVVQPAQ